MDKSIRAQVDLAKGKSITYHIPTLDKTARTFLRRLTVLFGESHTGKTSVLLDILYILKEYIPCVIVFSANERENKDFKNKLPKALIYYTCNYEVLKKIYQRQSIAADIYSKANDINVLSNLFERVADANVKNTLIHMSNLKATKIESLRRSNLTHEKKNAEINKLNELFLENKIKIYKHYIGRFQTRLQMMNFPKDSPEGICLKYLHFNPNMAIVFDDMAAEIKNSAKKDETLQKLFYQGRHVFITSFYLFQDDKTIPPALRKNAFLKIFTTHECANSYFSTTTNGLSRDLKKIGEAAANTIFKQEDSSYQNYKKLVYIRDAAENKIQYVIADMHPEGYKLCSPYVWQLCEEKEAEDTLDASNDFYNHFIT